MKNMRKKGSSHETENKLNVNINRKRLVLNKKRHNNHSLSQVNPIKEVIPQPVASYSQNFSTIKNTKRRSIDGSYPMHDSVVSFATSGIPSNLSVTSHRPKNRNNTKNNKQLELVALPSSLFSTKTTRSLNEQFNIHISDKETSLSRSTKDFNPKTYTNNLNKRTSLLTKFSLDRSKSTHDYVRPTSQTLNKRKKPYSSYCPCSPCCAMLAVLGATLLLAGLAALMVFLANFHQSTSGSTSMVTNTPISAVPITTTVSSTTTITITTSTTTTTPTTITTTTTSTIPTTITTSTTPTTATTTITTTTISTIPTTMTTSTITTTTTSVSTTIITSTSTTLTTTTSITTVTTCSPVFASTSGLDAYFPLDSSPSYLTDVNGTMTATASSATNVVGERNQCLSFTGTMNSYFQTSTMISLGTVNAPFSIAVYINPNVLSGTIVHISKFQNGTSAWCLPFIGFASTSHLAIQVWGGSTANYVLGPIPPLNSWTHVVQTWSTTNGLTLYIDGALYAQDSSVTTYAASGVPNYLTLASTLLAIPYPANGCSTTGVLGGLGYYDGLIDELRVYNRELSALEVCALANY